MFPGARLSILAVVVIGCGAPGAAQAREVQYSPTMAFCGGARAEMESQQATTADPCALARPKQRAPLSTGDPELRDRRVKLIELSPDFRPDGRFARPHHAIGIRSDAAGAWLREQGIDASNCYLPMVRLHTKVSSSDARGTLWVYFRCALR